MIGTLVLGINSHPIAIALLALACAAWCFRVDLLCFAVRVIVRYTVKRALSGLVAATRLIEEESAADRRSGNLPPDKKRRRARGRAKGRGPS